MKHRFKMLCMAISLCMLVTCFVGCTEETVRDPNALLYDTFEEFEATGIHRHPETDDNLRYALYDTYVQVIEYISDNPNIIIPNEYKGLPVISIRANAFSNKDTLHRVTLGQNLLHIGEAAFKDCVNLEQVTMSASVNDIQPQAFAGCQSLVSITIPPKVTTLYSGTFSGCVSLKKVIVESNLSLIEVENEEKDNTRGDKDEESERIIESSTFDNCDSLRIMWIPEDIGTVEDSILGGTTPKPLICGGDGTASAYFATLQCLDYMLVNRDEFDTQARWYKDVDLVDRTEFGQSIDVGNFKVRLDDVKYYDKLGSILSGDNATLVVAKFTVGQNTQISQYFNGFNVTCLSHAPGKDGLMGDFVKQPILIPENVLNYSYPVGKIPPGGAIEGIIVLKVSDRFESISITFDGAEESFII